MVHLDSNWGRGYQGYANVIENSEQVAAGLLEFVAHNSEMTQRGYYALPRGTGGQVDQAALRAAAETRVMIVICLGQELLHRRKQNSPRTKALMRAVVRLHTSIYRLSNLRHAGAAVDNRGRRTRLPFTVPLTYFEDRDQYIVVGAMDGVPNNPAWVHNLREHPLPYSDRRISLPSDTEILDGKAC